MSELLPFSSHRDSDDPTFDVSDLIQEICERLESLSIRQGVNLEVDAPPYTMVSAPRAKLQQIIDQLLRNALAVTPRGNDVIVTACVDDAGVEIEVADSGNWTDLSYPIADQQADSDRSNWSALQGTVAELGAELSRSDCPDGGIACTIHFPRSTGEGKSSRQAA